MLLYFIKVFLISLALGVRGHVTDVMFPTVLKESLHRETVAEQLAYSVSSQAQQWS